MRLEFCHWLDTNHQLLLFILFTDEATLISGMNNTCNNRQ